MKKFLLILFSVLFWGSLFSQGNAIFIDGLTDIEKQWLDNNKHIKVLFHKSDFKPIWFFDNHYSSGISSDYLEYIINLTGLKVDTIIADWSYGIELVSNGSVDLACSVIKTPDREKLMKFSSPQLFFEHYICAKQDKKYIPENISELKGSVVAVEKGFYTLNILKEYSSSIAIDSYDNTADALRAVSDNKADFYIGNKLNIENVIANENINLKMQRFSDIDDYPVCFGVSNSKQVLHSIINKAMDFIPQSDKQIIIEKNTPKFDSKNLLLFEDEKKYLDSLGELKVGFKSFREPLEFLDKNGNPAGIILEIFSLISTKLNIKFKPVFYSDFNKLLSDTKKGQVDIIASVIRTEERSKYLIFSDTYLSFPYLVVGLSNRDPVRNFDNLHNKKIAVYSSYWLIDEISISFPNCEVIGYQSYSEFYNALVDNKVDFGITNEISYNYFSQLKKYRRLEIYFESQYFENCCIGVSPKHKKLVSILSRAIALTGKTTTGYIVQKWENTMPNEEYDVILIRNILAIVSLILLIVAVMFLFHFLRLRRELKNVKSLELKLNSSEEEYSRIFNSMNDIYYKLDTNGNILKLSPSVYKATGYIPSDLVGKNEISFYKNPVDRDKLLESIFEKGYINNYKLTLTKANGEDLPVSINAKLLNDSNNKLIGFEGIIRDVSDSVLSEISVKKSEQKLKTILQLANLGISHYDFETNSFEFNESICKIIFNKNEVLKLALSDFFELVHPLDKDSVIESFHNLFNGVNDGVKYDCRFATSNGNYSWFSNRFVRLQTEDSLEIIGVHLNITDLKNNISVLSENQRKLEAIYNSVQIMLIAIDQDMIMREVNDVVVAVSGLMKHELIGQSISLICQSIREDGKKNKFYIPADVCEIIRNSLDNFDNIYEYEFQTFILDNEGDSILRYYTLSTSVFNVDDNLQLLASFIDITSRKNFEIEVEKARSILEENSRLKTDFISNLSYELRTPINSIAGFVSLLKNKSVTQPEKEKYVEIIKESSGKLLNIVDNVIELSRAEFNELEYMPSSFVASELILQMANHFRQEATNKNLSFLVENDSIQNKAIVISDVNKVKSVLLHFIENAIKYTSIGNITIGYKKISEGTEFFVKDTGIGISQHELISLKGEEKIVDNSNIPAIDAGMGISLRLCKAYLKVIGSELNVISTQGKGSEFSFIIKDTTKTELPAPEVKLEKKKSNGVVLIVEDEDYNYNYLSQILELEDYDYIIADDGQKAVDIVKQTNKIDIILMDIRLPGIDGIEASRLIKQIRPDIPIIAQTAYSLETDEDRLMEQYCDDYIQKPVVSKSLIQKIRNLMEKK